jgi:hypothetical protein
MYALIENGEVTRINITLPVSIGNTSIGKGATGLEAFGLYPIVGDEPSHTEQERIAGPQYVFDGTQVNRVFTVEAIPDAEKASQVRAERDSKLAETDWVTIRAMDTGTAMSAEWSAYRQALRDITAQAGFPWNVTWPEKP